MRPLLLSKSKKRLLYILSLALVVMSALIGTARAGDIASRHFIGFSPDGSYFALEEYGVQDGSGFPYSHIFITNTRKNSWVKGSPIRVLLQDEKASLTEARQQAMLKASGFIKQFEIGAEGALLAHNPVTEIGRNAREVTVAPGPVPFLTKYALTFKIKDQFIETKRCKDYGPDSQMGYALTVQRKGEEPVELHKDNRIPTSRGCPRDYAISDVVRFQPDPAAKEALYIVVIQTFSYGFEGNDGRYIASSYWLPTFNATN